MKDTIYINNVSFHSEELNHKNYQLLMTKRKVGNLDIL